MNHEFKIFGLLALVLITSGCMSSTTSSDMSPEATVEAYIGHLTGFSEDTEASYEMLSSDVRDNTDYVDYHSDITTLKSAYSRQGLRFEVLQTENISQSESEATVELTLSAESAMGGTMTPNTEVSLVKEDETWKIDQELNPYDIGSGEETGNTDQNTGSEPSQDDLPEDLQQDLENLDSQN